jgi:putative transposase
MIGPCRKEEPMPRVLRWRQLARDAAYHVMTRGHNREALFRDAGDTRSFLGLLDRYRRRFGFRLDHDCLMTNHVHLLVQLDDPRRLSALMAGLLIAYVRYVNGRHSFVGHLIQGRFKSFPVAADEHLDTVLRYVERNALRAGLVQWAEGWRWGSLWRRTHPDTLPRIVIPPWSAPEPDNGPDLVNQAQTEAERAAVRQAVVRGRPCGPPAWQEQTARRLGLEFTLRRRGRPRKAAPAPQAPGN